MNIASYSWKDRELIRYSPTSSAFGGDVTQCPYERSIRARCAQPWSSSPDTCPHSMGHLEGIEGKVSLQHLFVCAVELDHGFRFECRGDTGACSYPTSPRLMAISQLSVIADCLTSC